MNVKVNRITLLGNVIAKIAELERKVDPTYINLIASKLRDVFLQREILKSDVCISTDRNYYDKSHITLSVEVKLGKNDNLTKYGLSKENFADYLSFRTNKGNLQRLREVRNVLQLSTQTDVTSSQYKDVFALLT